MREEFVDFQPSSHTDSSSSEEPEGMRSSRSREGGAGETGPTPLEQPLTTEQMCQWVSRWPADLYACVCTGCRSREDGQVYWSIQSIPRSGQTGAGDGGGIHFEDPEGDGQAPHGVG